MLLKEYPFTHNITIECYDNIEFEKVLTILTESKKNGVLE